VPSPYKQQHSKTTLQKHESNKENGNISLRQKSLSPTINKFEIRDAAMRISATNSVKKMREKFENKDFGQKNDTIDESRLAPKLLIKKFEELSSSSAATTGLTESAIKKRIATLTTPADSLKRKFDHSSPIIEKKIAFVDDDEDDDDENDDRRHGDPEETNVLIDETARTNGTICGNIDDLDCKDIDRTISNDTNLMVLNANKHSTFIKVFIRCFGGSRGPRSYSANSGFGKNKC
jgi:hypothetical protein